MERVAPSVIAREQLHGLLVGGVDRESNIISALVEAMVRLMVQELLEGEQSDSRTSAPTGTIPSHRAAERRRRGYAG
jgi:hypothetical protein